MHAAPLGEHPWQASAAAPSTCREHGRSSRAGVVEQPRSLLAPAAVVATQLAATLTHPLSVLARVSTRSTASWLCTVGWMFMADHSAATGRAPRSVLPSYRPHAIRGAEQSRLQHKVQPRVSSQLLLGKPFACCRLDGLNVFCSRAGLWDRETGTAQVLVLRAGV